MYLYKREKCHWKIDINAIFQDEHTNCLQRFQLIEREQVENAPNWLKTSSPIPQCYIINTYTILGQVISEEMQANAYKKDVLRQRAELKLKEIEDGIYFRLIRTR